MRPRSWYSLGYGSQVFSRGSCKEDWAGRRYLPLALNQPTHAVGFFMLQSSKTQESVMKILITKPGIFRGFGDPLPVGSVVEVPDDFTGWAGKWQKIEGSDQPLEVATPKRRRKPKAEPSEADADE